MKVHRFRGKRWNIAFRGKWKDKTEGMCDAPDIKGKAIRLDRTLAETKFLEAAIHEGLHACLWDLDEEAVHDTAHDIARFLWRLGFRRGMME